MDDNSCPRRAGYRTAIGPVATATIIAILAPSNRRAEGMAYNGNAIALANLYSPLLAFWLFRSLVPESHSSMRGLCRSPDRLCSRRLGKPNVNPRDPLTTSSESAKPPLISRSALFPTLVFLTYTFTTAPASTFLPQLARMRNLGNPGLYYTANSIVQMLALPMSGLIADRLGRGSVIVPGLLVVGCRDVPLGSRGQHDIVHSVRGLEWHGLRYASARHSVPHCGPLPSSGARDSLGDPSAGMGRWRFGWSVPCRPTGIRDRHRRHIRHRRSRNASRRHRIRDFQRTVVANKRLNRLQVFSAP